MSFFSKVKLNILACLSCIILLLCLGFITCSHSMALEGQVSRKRPKVALALGGGGTRGAAHVGVLKVFAEEKIPIDFIVGTSMGSVVGGLYCAGVSVESLEKMFKRGKMMHAFMSVPLHVRAIEEPFLLLPRLVGHHSYSGLYKGSKFARFLKRTVPKCHKNMEDLDPKFQAVALNLLDGKVYGISSGSLVNALRASSAVPILRRPVEVGDKLFVDGGVLENVPVRIARETGADIVIAVDVDEHIRDMKSDEFRKLGSVAQRIITIQLANADRKMVSKADYVIRPSVDGIGLISTKKHHGAKAIDAGELAAKKAIPEIKKLIEGWESKSSCVEQVKENDSP